MIYSIRPGLFETNSSSVHALIIMTENEYKRWQDGRFIRIPRYYNTPIDVEIKEPTIVDKWVADEDTSDLYYNDDEYDHGRYIERNYIPSEIEDDDPYIESVSLQDSVDDKGNKSYILDLEYDPTYY